MNKNAINYGYCVCLEMSEVEKRDDNLEVTLKVSQRIRVKYGTTK